MFDDNFVVIGSKVSDKGLRGEVWNRQFGSPRYQQASIFKAFLDATNHDGLIFILVHPVNQMCGTDPSHKPVSTSELTSMRREHVSIIFRLCTNPHC